ncbi:hypothetical protein OZ410_13365 [Robiginitalea sp. M366]|uniref:hypothetical protein n=1 Tax=Robiginitalea aestuariiviva TaxID=3036903 RepID=UPI00240D130B|nr:hypothetical protein [Robiginitalea aestuariiviva]MDG1573312.1 hypothetical protein [Robiginitalea aestuariiviva]
MKNMQSGVSFLFVLISLSQLDSIYSQEALFSPPTDGPNQFFIDFVGTANLQGNLNQANEELQGSAGLGVIFERYYLKNDQDGIFFESLDMEAYINVASSVDSLKAVTTSAGEITNKRDFGSYILNPISSKQSVFINANLFFNPELNWEKSNWITKWISGANFRVNASNVLWNYEADNETIGINASAINLRFGIFHEFIPNDKIRDDNNRRKYSVTLGINYTFRELAGDISSPTNDPLRSRFLGTTDTSYSGIEPSFGFRLNNIIAEFSMPMIGGGSRNDIEGLTDTQFLFSIRFVGGFSLKLNDTAENDG